MTKFATSHPGVETHVTRAGGMFSPPPITGSKPITSSLVGGVPPTTPPPIAQPTPTLTTVGGFLDLRIWAESFNDAQQARIALVNRMERGGVDADILAGHRQLLEASEHAFKLAMIRSYRRIVRTHMPNVEVWQKETFGVGEHMLARLLGHLGHPTIANPYVWMDEKPDGHECIAERCGKRHLVALQPFVRTVGQLWQYCGHGSPDRRRAGMSQDDAMRLGKSQCKMLVHLMAESAMKVSLPPEVGSPQPRNDSKPSLGSVGDKFKYRRIYETRRIATSDRGWTDGHSHADALRIIGKEILRDLWLAQGDRQW